jgi:FkbM family methyltransferase
MKSNEMIRRRNRRQLLTILSIFLLLILIYNLIFSNNSLDSNTVLVVDTDGDGGDAHQIVSEYKHGIFLYNMNEPIDTWWNTIECIDTRMAHTLNTKLCIHDAKYDRHVSGQLKQHGLWEPNNVRSFIKQMSEVPDAKFIDIGANIGLYTLIAAKYNRNVIAIEPLHDNMIRIHKAAYLENVRGNIVALVNAISNERKQLNIQLVDDNIGGSFVINEEEVAVIDADNIGLTRSSVIVNSILIDDLVDVITIKYGTKGLNGEKLKFIVKIDIESYEPFAFENSTQLFQKFDIIAIYLETGKILEKLKFYDDFKASGEEKKRKQALYSKFLTKVLNMINMFKSLNYQPYEVNGYNMLEYTQWRHWPWDIYLRNCDLLTCPGRPFKVQGV